MKAFPCQNESRWANTETFPFEMGYLPDKFVRKAEEELHETPEAQEHGLQQLREMFTTDKHLCSIKMTDDFIVHYLRARKYNLQKTFSLIKKFWTFMRKHKLYFERPSQSTLNINTIQKVLSFLPLRDKDGCAILMVKLHKWDPDHIPVDDMIRLVTLILMFSVEDTMTQVNGYKVILDTRSNPLKYIRYCTPFYISLLYHGTQDCLPGRFKGIHIVNPSFIFRTAWSILSPFMPEKLKKRIFLHENGTKSLQNFFPECIIPVEYGGEMKEFDISDWLTNSYMSPCVTQYSLDNATI